MLLNIQADLGDGTLVIAARGTLVCLEHFSGTPKAREPLIRLLLNEQVTQWNLHHSFIMTASAKLRERLVGRKTRSCFSRN